MPEPTPALYAIRLCDDAGERVITARAGEDLTLPEAEAPQGYVFYAWFDQNGELVNDPLTVTCDLSLYARCLPALTDAEHAPYLDMDASWRTRPDDPVSHAELVRLFASLVSIPAEEDESTAEPVSRETRTSKAAKTEKTESEDYLQAVALLRRLGGISGEDFASADAVTRDELFTMLALFYPVEKEKYEFKDLNGEDDRYPAFCLAAAQGWLADTGQADPDAELTRLSFAVIMNDVLHRSGDPAVLSAAREVLFDLPEEEEEALAMLEATVRHEPSDGEEHELWDEVGLPERPFADFTTGDLEVDFWIKQIFEEQLTEEMSLRDKLAALYRYVRSTSRYRKGEIHKEADTAWVLTETRKMMEEGGGNCFTYSSTLCELYRALGVDARIYAGTISENENPHAWVEATIDGTVYIFDVEMEATRMRLEKPYVDFFMRTYYELKGWDYKRDYVVEWR